MYTEFKFSCDKRKVQDRTDLEVKITPNYWIKRTLHQRKEKRYTVNCLQND